MNTTDKITFSSILIKWIEEKHHLLKSSSYYNYYGIIKTKIIPYFGDFFIEDITNDVLFDFLSQLYGLSNNYILSIFRILQSILEDYPKVSSVIKRFIKENVPNVSLQKNRIRLLDIGSIKKLITILMCCDNRYNLGILIAIYTGMRIGEICALRYNDIDFKREVIYVTHTVYRVKNEKSNHTKLVITTPKSSHSIRTIPLHDNILRSIRIETNDQFILTNTLTPLDPRVLRRYFNELTIKNQIPKIRFHDLRHTFASFCIDNGYDYKTVSELLGHSSVSTTLNLYVHTNIEKKKQYIHELYIKSP